MHLYRNITTIKMKIPLLIKTLEISQFKWKNIMQIDYEVK